MALDRTDFDNRLGDRSPPSPLEIWRLRGAVARKSLDQKRVLNWRLASRRKVGRPFATWETYFEKFCRYNGLGTWYTVAADVDLWRSLMDDFVLFCFRS